jgi:glyceraldehyde-3-phosphate dehydrogenase (NADP+)
VAESAALDLLPALARPGAVGWDWQGRRLRLAALVAGRDIPRMTANAPRQLLIENQWLSTADRLAVVNPFTGAEIARVPLGNREHLSLAIDAAQRAFAKTRATPAHARALLLQKVARGIEQRRDEFVETIIAEAGKPVAFAEAEVARAVMTFTVAAEEARRAHGELLAMDALPTGEGHFGLARRFPIGVIAAITPFNFPLNLVAHKVGPCLATGNTMVVKPATKTPLTALLLAQVLVEAGVPAGQVNFVTCSNEDAAVLITDERVKKVTFTGSPAVGWKLKEQCGKKKITLELGGNAGVIVHSDAALDAAIPAIANGAFGQAGQSCISVQRVVIRESIYEEFRRRFAAFIAEKVKAGDPTDRANIIGPMITREALEKTVARIDEAVSAGAKIVCGGKASGQCLDATVIENAAAHLPICAEEVFAPVCTLHRYCDFEEALAFVNDSAFGLQAGIYTRDLQLAMRAFETLEVGGVLINQVPTFRVENMPYGGVKESGFGREGVRYAMEEMTELRSLVVKRE